MALSKRSRPPRRPYHHGNLRRALLDEALATIRTEGVEGVTLREIGARLGVSRTALYRHFADKQALLAAVATEGFRALRERLTAAWEDGGRNLPAWEAMGIVYVRFAVENPSHFRVMFSRFIDPDPRQPDLAVEAKGTFQALVNAVVSLQRDGWMHADPPELMAQYIWSVVHGVAMLAIDGQLAVPAAIDALARYAIERLGTGVIVGDRRLAAHANAR